MNYLLIVVEPRGQRAERSPDQGRAAYDSMVGFAEGLQRRGVLRAVESLQSDDRGKRVHAGRTVDGPFSEAKEMVGGFFLIDVASFDEALAIAHECPAAQWATVEVRAAAPCYE